MKKLLGLLLAVGMVFMLGGCNLGNGDFSSTALDDSCTSEDMKESSGASAPVIDGDNELPLIPIA